VSTAPWQRNPSAFLVCALALSALARAADWPQWLGPARDGITPEGVRSWPPRETWRAEVGLGYTSPVVAEGRVYLLGHERGPEGTSRGTDTVYCLDAGTGDVIWKHSYGCLTEKRDSTAGYPGPRATPAVGGDAVYTLSLEGHLLCLDAGTGSVIWKRNLPEEMGAEVPFYGFCSSPLVHRGRAIVEANAPDGGSYVAFDARTGRVVWRSGSESASTASPSLALVDGRTYVLFVSGKVLAACDAGTGKLAWRVDLGWDTWMGAVPSGELVFASSASLARGAAVYRFGESEPLWRSRRDYQSLHCNAVVWRGHVYGSDNTRTDYQYEDPSRSRLKCIDLETGEVNWTLKGLGWANVIVAGGRLLVLREEGELVLMEVSPDGHRELGRAKVIEGPCWTVPALADGRLYVRSNRGGVVCLDVRPE
jgi:outer membrane protein assembly factor BamB